MLHSFWLLYHYCTLKESYSQTGCSFDGNSAMLWRNVPILMGSLLDTTCNIQFKFARASCQVPVFDIPVLKVIIPSFVSKKWEIIALWSTIYQQTTRN